MAELGLKTRKIGCAGEGCRLGVTQDPRLVPKLLLYFPKETCRRHSVTEFNLPPGRFSF